MKCKNPNYIRIGLPDENGKYHPLFINGRTLVHYRAEKMIKEEDFIEVPCGNCIPCRLEYSRNWANRCYLESLCHDHTWFITLTYRDEELKFGEKGLPTLENDALRKFMNKLRTKLGFNQNIRYFGCGEYGDAKGERAGFNPHYHIIVFGAPITDLTIDHPDMSKESIKGKYPIFRRNNKKGDPVYWSQTIYDCWKKGKVEIEEATWNCAAYVSRYVLKKVKGCGKIIYDRLGIVPEFIRMSNRPGIGAEYLLEHKDKLLDLDYLCVKNTKGVQTSHPPRYFEKLMNKDEDSIEAAQMAAIKVIRVRNAKKRCEDSTSKKSLKQKQLDEAEIIENKTKVFTRDLN